MMVSRLEGELACLLLLCSALVGACGGAQRHTKNVTPLRTAAYGFVAVEPIEEDGSKHGLGVAPNLVERMDEVRSALPMLQQTKVALALMMQAHKLADRAKMDEVFGLIEDAQARGIEVVIVPVLSADDGYFPNATNYDKFLPVARELVSQWKRRGLTPTTLYVDMEPSRDLMQALTSFKLGKALPRDHIDRERFSEATNAFSRLVDELHADGWKVAVTTQATLLGDYDDGDDDMRQYFNVVLDGPAWDQMDFQLYRSAFTSQVPGLDAYFVYKFAKKAMELFPRALIGVGVGLTHPGPIYPKTPTYKSSKSLREDVQAARRAGVPRERITVYNLKGILLGPPVCDKLLGCEPAEYHYQDNDVGSWFVQDESSAPPEESATCGALTKLLGAMDGLLDMSKDSHSGQPAVQ